MENSMNTLAIIQARMASVRLPGKVLAEINGQPLIGRLIHRVSAAQSVDHIVVATTIDPSDDVLVNWCAAHKVDFFRGSVDDVLDRFWQCAQQNPAEFIVRVTADDPLKDPKIITQALSLCASDPSVDYASNTLQPTYPEGLDIEVIRFRALERAVHEASLPSEREHVMPYVWKNPDRFVLRGFGMQPNLSHWRLTVDKPADLEVVRRIYNHFADQPLIDYQSVIDWLTINPELLAINSGTIRHEGYHKSLSEELRK
jgi:spore coat polysaccharide biosynthesis protein SpsF